MRVVRVERQVRSVQVWQANSCSQALLGLILEASQVVASPHLLHLGGGGVCGGQVSLGWKYIVFLGCTRGAVVAGGDAGEAGAGGEGAGAGVAAAGEGAVGAGAGSRRLCALPT